MSPNQTDNDVVQALKEQALFVCIKNSGLGTYLLDKNLSRYQGSDCNRHKVRLFYRMIGMIFLEAGNSVLERFLLNLKILQWVPKSETEKISSESWGS